ncbi:MAG: Rne/Rng family ribonuclease [Acidimicrobiia bacterium]
MTDETTPEATASEPTSPEPQAPEPAASPDATSPNGDATARKRRRRGSRGGRNRRKPAGARPPAGEGIGEDWNDPAADRGLTAEDLAADAREDAGLPATTPTAARPKIGDSRPAPAAAGATPKTGRRRRRGGRGRNKGAAAPAPTSGRDDVVHADLGVGDAVALEDLDEETLARRRGRTRKGRPAGRYLMCVHVRDDRHTHIALLEGRVLVEHEVATAERDEAMSIDGNIYLGRVQNVLPGMEAAFIDIGTPKNGVLYRGDVAYDPDEVEEKQPRIERLLKNGQSIVVQVTKNPIGAKGARLTQEVSLAGRFVVMVPSQPSTYGISKRLPDDERKRLRRVLEDLRPPDAGLIVRTAAEGATAEELERDVRRLREQWDQISALADRSKPARLLYQEPPLVTRLLREEFTKEYRGVLIDDHALYEEIHSYVEAIAPELADRIEYYDAEEEGIPLFERHHVHEQLLKALDRKVWLPSGGSIVIERTEALTVVDVNTGKNVGKSNLEETVFRNNLEAADEVARQLRLRDIGGIIVIDFIDMEIRPNRDALVKAFRDALARDKTRTQVFDVSELGLVEMTRKRVSEGLVESVSATCSMCNGRGYIIDEALLEELQ